VQAPGSGRLLVVGTPIGNLEDLSPRAVKAFAGADMIFCEDTRRTRKLLSAIGVSAPRLLRLDQHNEAAMTATVIDAILDGATAVLVTDAGMPTISDPGDRVVRSVAGAGLPVDVVPGPTAASAALALSGLPASNYRFAGFLPRKGRPRADALTALAQERSTAVIYESPSRVARTVAELSETCGAERQVVLARELTKVHQEVWRGTLENASRRLEEPGYAVRGEWVIVLAGAEAHTPAGDNPGPGDEAIAGALTSAQQQGLDTRASIARVAKELNVPKRRVYDIAVRLKG
jgi:16S rRNA (cytidine1402-2'-O)-methyltransferase